MTLDDQVATPATAARGPSRIWRVASTQESVVLAVTAILVIAFAAALPSFRAVSNLLLLLQSVSVLGILGLGLAVVVIARGLDLSLVANMATSLAVTLTLMSGHSVGVSVGVGVGVALAVGALNGFVIAFVEVPALLATLAMGLLEYGIARSVYLGSQLVQIPNGRGAFLRTIGASKLAGIPIAVLIFLGLAAILHWILTRTVFGRFVYAHGDNPAAAELAGMATRPLTVAEYMLCAGIGYVAGMVLIGTVDGIDTSIVGGSMIFQVVLVVVLGGVSLAGARGGVVSVLAGTLLVGVMVNAMTLLNLSDTQQQIFEGLILLAALVADIRLHPRDEETTRQGD